MLLSHLSDECELRKGEEQHQTQPRSRAHPPPAPSAMEGAGRVRTATGLQETLLEAAQLDKGKKKQMQDWRSPTLGWGRGRRSTPNQPLLTSAGSPGTTPLPRLTQILLPGPACQEQTVLPAILCSKACLVGAPGGRMAPEESVTRRPIPSLDATLHLGGHEGCRAARGEAGTCRGNDPEDSPKERPWPRPGQSLDQAGAGGSETGCHLWRASGEGDTQMASGAHLLGESRLRPGPQEQRRGPATDARQGPSSLLSLGRGCLVTLWGAAPASYRSCLL